MKHSCAGKMLSQDGIKATCYECGRTIPVGGPIIIGNSHLADIKGSGLRSTRR